jgi:hypothetical protein
MYQRERRETVSSSEQIMKFLYKVAFQDGHLDILEDITLSTNAET